MRGEFDDLLKWPFRGNIAYVLLDQEGDNHIVKTTNFDDTVPEYITTRIVTVERNTTGRGNFKMIALSDLRPKYLKNDCIKLCIKKIQLTP